MCLFIRCVAIGMSIMCLPAMPRYWDVFIDDGTEEAMTELPGFDPCGDPIEYDFESFMDAGPVHEGKPADDVYEYDWDGERWVEPGSFESEGGKYKAVLLMDYTVDPKTGTPDIKEHFWGIKFVK